MAGDTITVLDSLRTLARQAGPEGIRALEEWVTRHVEPTGTIAGLSPSGWHESLELMATRIRGIRLSPPSRTAIGALRRAVAGFRRPDGSMAFSPSEGGVVAARAVRPIGSVASYPGLVRAAIRDRFAGVDFLFALDHTGGGREAAVELHALGRNWLTSIAAGAAPAELRGTSSATWRSWSSEPEGDVVEYRFQHDGSEVDRTVVWIRSRRLLLIADDTNGSKQGERALETELALADGVRAEAAVDGTGLWLSDPALPGVGMRLIGPMWGLKATGQKGDASSIALADSRQPGWNAMVLCIDPRLALKPPLVRALTISEGHRIVEASDATAFRIAWAGQAESLVVYRSRKPAERRAFLGYQCAARFLVGTFSRKGELTPLIQRD